MQLNFQPPPWRSLRNLVIGVSPRLQFHGFDQRVLNRQVLIRGYRDPILLKARGWLPMVGSA